MNDTAAGQITGVVLAGGKSRRMGHDKALLPIDGMPFMQRILDTMSEIFPDLIISAGESKSYEQFRCRVAHDLFPDSGPLGGIHAALLATQAESIFVTTCDMPFISSALINHILSQSDPTCPAMGMDAAGRLLLLGRIPVSAADEISTALARGERRVSAMLALLPTRKIDCSGFSEQIVNINTPSQYSCFVPPSNHS